MLKTTAARFEALRARVVALHPYEVPEVISLAVDAGNTPYLAWVAGEGAEVLHGGEDVRVGA